MVDHSLLQDFITESTEHLEELESSLLALEKDPDSIDILNDIFRAIHSIKGAFGMGQYLVNSRPTAYAASSNTNEPLIEDATIYLKN